MSKNPDPKSDFRLKSKTIKIFFEIQAQLDSIA